ncbi:hypothetical protein ACTFIZ_002544 [Dictyostelium cf. discoideum]
MFEEINDDNESLNELFKRIEKIETKIKQTKKSYGKDKNFGLDQDYKSTERLEVIIHNNKERFLEKQPNSTIKSNHKNDDNINGDGGGGVTTSLVIGQHSNLQYSSIYASRLEKLNPILVENVESKYPGIPIQKILHMKPGDECIMIGTLYKEMELKPNILKAYAQDRAMLPIPDNRESFIGENDKLFFEDNTGRVKLIGSKEMVDSLVTGLNVAILGKGLPDAEFEVKDIVFPGIPPQPHSRDLESLKDDAYICLISGLNIGNANNIFQTQLLMDYLQGNLVDNGSDLLGKICKVLFVGNSIHKENEPIEAFVRYSSKSEIQAKQAKKAIPIKDLDGFLCELCQSVPVDIIPGPNDPTNISLPQLPLNSCLFPFSIQNTNLTTSTNPYQSQIGGRLLLGTSGQNIENASRYMTYENKMSLTESTLIWRHLAPTAPDTLTCAALDNDPFVIDQCPHIYFIGNQDHFETKLLKGPNDEIIRLIFIPNFSETNTIILVNLKTLDTFPIHFNTTSFFPQSPSTEQ